MDMQKLRQNSRNLGTAGSVLLTLGICIYLFFGGIAGHLHSWAHALGGLFLGMSIVCLMRAIWFSKHREAVGRF